MRSALTRTLVSKTYLPSVFIQDFLQNFRSKATLLRLLADFVHYYLERLPRSRHFAEPDAEQSLQFPAFFCRSGLESFSRLGINLD